MHIARLSVFQAGFLRDSLVPHLVDELRAHAGREHCDAQRLELVVLLGDGQDLGQSHEGKIPRVEAEDHPLAQIVGELDLGPPCDRRV